VVQEVNRWAARPGRGSVRWQLAPAATLGLLLQVLQPPFDIPVCVCGLSRALRRESLPET
jgi:hypothetical protein